jgi:hypothetical protein
MTTPSGKAATMNRQPTTQQLQVLTARGTDGTITFDGQTVTIRRRGLLARMVHGAGDITLPVASLTAVRYKSRGLSRGKLTLLTVGSIVGPDGGSFRFTRDPMSVEFNRHGRDFKAMRDALNHAISQLALARASWQPGVMR